MTPAVGSAVRTANERANLFSGFFHPYGRCWFAIITFSGDIGPHSGPYSA